MIPSARTILIWALFLLMLWFVGLSVVELIMLLV